MIDRSRKYATAATVFTFLMAIFNFTRLVPAQTPDASRPAPPLTTNVVYRFLPDGITKSGYSHGELVYDEVIQGADGNFYGTTTLGGSGLCTGPFGVQGCGTVYKLTPAGVQTVIYNFQLDSSGTTAVNGIYPYGGLVQGPDGNFYGTTTGGGNVGAVCNGNLGCGVVFRLTPTGRYTVLHTFNGSLATPADGGVPTGRLLFANGKFYGTTYSGGLVQGFGNQGTIFTITTSGSFGTIYMFDNVHGITDGVHPYAGLIQGKDGSFYGTTQFGGTSNAGTVFKYSGGPQTTVLKSFDEQTGSFFPDGAYPYAALVQASDGNLYGTTSYGGALTTFYQSGTLFRVTTKGVFTKLWDFNATDPSVNGIDGYGALIQASDGNLYGTTQQGGTANAGTVFEVTLGGVLSQLLSFDSVTDGAYPQSVPLQASDGTLYITTSTTTNGTDQGDVLQIANSLAAPAPVVARFSPTSGKVGIKVTITGANFVGTTAVAFNGTPATFVVKSTSTLVATVPTGATSGHITVTNAGGSTASSGTFTVLP